MGLEHGLLVLLLLTLELLLVASLLLGVLLNKDTRLVDLENRGNNWTIIVMTRKRIAWTIIKHDVTRDKSI